MFTLFVKSSAEVYFGSWLNINHPFLHSFICSLWFGCVANWLLEELRLDAQYQIQGIPHFINGIYHVWDDSWNNLPTHNTWEYFATNWISAVICFVLVIAFYLLGFASLFFCDSLLSLLFLVHNILEDLSAQPTICVILQQHTSCTPPMVMPVDGKVCWYRDCYRFLSE